MALHDIGKILVPSSLFAEEAIKHKGNCIACSALQLGKEIA